MGGSTVLLIHLPPIKRAEYNGLGPDYIITSETHLFHCLIRVQVIKSIKM